MNACLQNRSDVVVAGFGSPHGDDQAGWHVLTLLAQRPNLSARLIQSDEQTQLIDKLDGCRTLIVIDACRGGSQIGAITRLEWPDPRIRQYHNHSVHGVRLCNALQLAERFGKLPPMVEVFGIDMGYHQVLDEMSPVVKRAVVELEGTIFAKICEAADARAIVC